MKALFIGAHCDEELCFAGTLIKFLEQGHDAETLFLSHCGDGQLHKECIASGEILGVDPMIHGVPVRKFRENSEQVVDLFLWSQKTNTIFTHSESDKHPDHRTVARESLRIFKGNLLTYIGPWNGNEDSNYFVELTEEQLEKKIAALACYKSQAHRKYMDPDFIRAWARYNGIKCGKLYAEGFKVVRLVQSL